METEPKVDLDVLAPSPVRVESCVSAVLAKAFATPPSIWDGILWAGRYALAAGLILATATWLYSLRRPPQPPPPPGPVPAYAPFPDVALLSLGTRGEPDAP